MPFEASATEDRDIAAPVPDHALSLQRARHGGNTGPLHPQHHFQKFLRQQEFIRLLSVMSHQQPSATPLPQRMKLIARGGLRDLVEESMGVMQHDFPH